MVRRFFQLLAELQSLYVVRLQLQSSRYRLLRVGHARLLRERRGQDEPCIRESRGR